MEFPTFFVYSCTLDVLVKLNYCMGHKWVSINSKRNKISDHWIAEDRNAGAATTTTETFKRSSIRSHNHLVPFEHLYLFRWSFFLLSSFCFCWFNKVPRKMPQFICIFVNLKLNLIEFIARKSP